MTFIISVLSTSVGIANAHKPTIDDPTPLKTSAPIYINGNSNFTSANGVSSGSGSSSNPYIIQGLNPSGGTYGIRIENTTAHFIIRNCTASGVWAGFYLSNANNGRIENCASSSHNAITLDQSCYNTIIGNTVSGAMGIIVEFYSHYNTVTYNHVSSCTHEGIYVSSSGANVIHHNDVIDNGNTPQGYDNTTSNQWDDGSEGNYWDDWTAPDTNQDGIVDTSYALSGGRDAKDNYPLTKRVGIEERKIETKYDSQVIKLSQNYPNPFNKTTEIKLQIPGNESQKSEIKLRAYDITGKLVRTFCVTPSPTNLITVLWDRKDNSGKELAPGIYFYSLNYSDFKLTRKAIIME